ncbi:MAG TPA: pyrroloquinoline quinone biosynthesis protein PqqB [Rhodanobacteraceae bacterium]|nr:pyrroloquinoline quinone biosynthesis protein PqqB [Rhodanobacteraceae bacterium]
MRVHVLGSSAGGGFPQWNCNCRLCAGVRNGTVNARPRTQSSIAVTGDGENWLLCNASPDILTQLRVFPGAQPARAIRDTGIAAIVLVDAQIDHTTGLCMLREHRQPLQVWCTDEVHEDLQRGHPMFRLLDHYCGVAWQRVPPDGTPFRVPTAPGLELRALPIASNAPPYSPHRDHPAPGDNIALAISDISSGRSLFYAPALGALDAATEQEMQRAHCVMVDGTCWTDDEMVALGLSQRRARDMGHHAVGDPGGTLDAMARLPAATRRIFIHINNTNPMLDEDGPQYARLRAAGAELAYDTMEFEP